MDLRKTAKDNSHTCSVMAELQPPCTKEMLRRDNGPLSFVVLRRARKAQPSQWKPFYTMKEPILGLGQIIFNYIDVSFYVLKITQSDNVLTN